MQPETGSAVAFDLLGDEMYVGGFAIPEGDYALEFLVKMSTPKEGSGNVSRLGIELTAHDLKDPEHRGDKAYKEFLSMGGKAHLSFAPDPETGKDIVPIPGAAGVTANDKTNWNVFRKSMVAAGLPKGLRLADIDGVHVRLGREPEPAERASFAKAATGEAAMNNLQPQTPKTIPSVLVLGDILEGDSGKPWEGGGGIPAEEEKKPAKTATKLAKPAAAKAAVKTAAKPAAAPTANALAPEGVDADEVQSAATLAIDAFLDTKKSGCPIVTLKTGVFMAIKKVDPVMAQAVMDAYLSSDEALNGLLEPLSFKVNGKNIEKL